MSMSCLRLGIERQGGDQNLHPVMKKDSYEDGGIVRTSRD